MGIFSFGGKRGVRLWSRADGSIGFSAGKPRKASKARTSKPIRGKSSRARKSKSPWTFF